MRRSTPKFLNFNATPAQGGGTGTEGGTNTPDDTGTEDAGAEAGTDSDDSEDADSDADEDEGASALGDPGKKALDRMKAERNAARKELRDLKAKYEPADKAEVDARTRFNTRILRSEIKAAAAGKLADPADAYRFLDLAQFEVSDDGEVDEDEIADAIKDLIEKKPYLAATQSERRNRGSADGGVRKEHSPSQLTRADLARMSPQEIVKADAQGRLDKLKGLK